MGLLDSRLLISAKELADLTGWSTDALAHMRCRGNGPPFVKRNRRVFYDPATVRSWLADRVQESTAETPDEDE